MKNSLFKLMLLFLLLNNHSSTNTMEKKLTGNSLKELFARRAKLATKYGSDTVPSFIAIIRDYSSIHPNETEKEFLTLICNSAHETLNPQQEEAKSKLIELFIAAGINLLNTQVISGMTLDALAAAIKGGNVLIIKTIIKALSEKGELQQSINRELNEKTLLMSILTRYYLFTSLKEETNNLEILELLLKNGADPHLKMPGKNKTHAEEVYKKYGYPGMNRLDRDEKITKLFDQYPKNAN